MNPDTRRAACSGQDGNVIDIRDYAATITGRDAAPCDDAADARWVEAGHPGALEVTDGSIKVLTARGVLGIDSHYRPVL